MQAFAEIPVDVISLDLGWNRLCNKTQLELEEILANIPAWVTALSLRGNTLAALNNIELSEFFAKIPVGITSLDLSNNTFYLKKFIELGVVFKKIPAGVTALNLSNNELGIKTCADLMVLFNALPEGIHTLTLSLKDIASRDQAELIALGKALPHMVNIHFIDESGNPVTHHPSIDILRTHSGSIIAIYVLGVYQMLMDEGLSAPLARLVLDVYMGAEQIILDRTTNKGQKEELKENNIGAVTRTSFFPPNNEEESQKLELDCDNQFSLS